MIIEYDSNLTAEEQIQSLQESVQRAMDEISAAYMQDIVTSAEKIHTTINVFKKEYAYFDRIVTERLDADEANIGTLQADDVYVKNQLIAHAANIDDLVAKYVEVNGKLVADEAEIGQLKAKDAVIEGNLSAITAQIGSLSTTYATIDLANVNNAWITNGVIKNGAIADAQIIGVSANKLTAGTIDAGKINVANLRAKNLIVERLNGQPVLGGYELVNQNSSGYEQKNPAQEGWYEYVNGAFVASVDIVVDMSKAYYKDGNQVALYDQTYIDNLEDDLNQRIDGAVETFSGSVVPTLMNYPAVDWTAAQMASHVGDLYYVINAASQADGFCYRFAYDSTSHTYGWVLIKDSDVTKALQDILEAQGDIADIKTFDTQVSRWQTDTDEEISSILSRTSSLETGLGTKVDTQTFNETKQTVDENSAAITALSTTVASKADSSTVTTISNKVNSVSDTVDAHTQSIGSLQTTVASKADGSTVSTLSSRVNSISDTVDGHTQTITNVQETVATKADGSTVTSLSNQVSTISDTVDGHTTSLSSLSSTVSGQGTRLSSAEATISQHTTAIALKAEASDVYTKTETDDLLDDKADSTSVYNKSEIDVTIQGITATVTQTTTDLTALTGRVTTAESSITQNANAIAAEVTARGDLADDVTASLSLKANKDTLTSEINASADTVQINANRVNIEGASIFSTGRLSTNSLSSSFAARNAAVAEERYIYIQAVANTSGVNPPANTEAGWNSVGSGESVSSDTAGQTPAWTTKRPTYRSNYPLIFMAKQVKMVDGTVGCSAVVKDDTLTIIDGGHITTGTLNANIIKAGVLSDIGGNTSFNLATGLLTINKGSINLGGGLFSATDAGYMTAHSGKIGPFEIINGATDAARYLRATNSNGKLHLDADGIAFLNNSATATNTLIHANEFNLTGQVWGNDYTTEIASPDESSARITLTDSDGIEVEGQVVFNEPASTFSTMAHSVSLAQGVKDSNVTDSAVIQIQGGWFPVGIVGYNTGRAAAVPSRMYLSDQDEGWAEISYSIRATANFTATTMTVYILWVKTQES